MKLNCFLLIKIIWIIGKGFADLNENVFHFPEDMKCIPPTANPCLTPISAQEKQELHDNCGKKESHKSSSKSKNLRKYIEDGEQIEFIEAPWTAAIFKNGLFRGIFN